MSQDAFANRTIADLREQYVVQGLHEQDLDPNPFTQFERWFQQALEAGVPEPNAMTLATATSGGKPSARIVLLKGVDERGFVFYTNYESRKGRELAANPHAALVFHWIGLARQVRITGTVRQISREESEAYFRSRPAGSQLGAWASRQSTVIADRSILEAELDGLNRQYTDGDIPLPPFWGGYRVVPEELEFWQGRPNRLHDRLRYRQQPDGEWLIERLSP